MPGPKLAPLILTGDDRAALEALARRRKTSQALARRARIVLACADGASVTAVAADLDVTRDTVRKWASTRSASLDTGSGSTGTAPWPV